jgi:hypothetical protein
MKGSMFSRYVRLQLTSATLIPSPNTVLMNNQVFVANPNKSYAVQRMLINNRDRLLRFLPTFLDDRTDDDQFMDEKSFLIRQIESLPTAPGPAPGAAS